ncbi:MAG: TatD family hydrolase [Candidatus Bruticola sp.]
MLLDGHFHPLDCLAKAENNHKANIYKIKGVGASSSPQQWEELRRWGKETGSPFVLGIHPWQAAAESNSRHNGARKINDWLHILESLLQETSLPCGIGEIGFDRIHNPQADLALQKELFYRQYCLAAKYQLPAVIHCVKAYNQLFEMLAEFKRCEFLNSPKLLIHSFWGSPELGKRLINMKFFISLNSRIITAATASANSPSAVKLKLLAEVIPVQNLILESDAPWGLLNQQQIFNLAQTMAPYWNVESSYFQNCCLNNLRLLFKL